LCVIFMCVDLLCPAPRSPESSVEQEVPCLGSLYPKEILIAARHIQMASHWNRLLLRKCLRVDVATASDMALALPPVNE
jgi:hypothetical protein